VGLFCVKLKGLASVVKLQAEAHEEKKSELLARNNKGIVIGKFRRSAVDGWWYEPGPSDPMELMRKFLNSTQSTLP
jgi:hypothetical protein